MLLNISHVTIQAIDPNALIKGRVGVTWEVKLGQKQVRASWLHF